MGDTPAADKPAPAKGGKVKAVVNPQLWRVAKVVVGGDTFTKAGGPYDVPAGHLDAKDEQGRALLVKA